MNAENKGGRPKCLRKVESPPEVNYFKPRGIPLTQLEAIRLKVEELEAMKLVYYEKLNREQAAKRMGVSRRTLGRELKAGIVNVVDGLLHGKAIEISGGYYISDGEKIFRCLDDKHEWKTLKSDKKPDECPECGSKKIKRKRR